MYILDIFQCFCKSDILQYQIVDTKKVIEFKWDHSCSFSDAQDYIIIH